MRFAVSHFPEHYPRDSEPPITQLLGRDLLISFFNCIHSLEGPFDQNLFLSAAYVELRRTTQNTKLVR